MYKILFITSVKHLPKFHDYITNHFEFDVLENPTYESVKNNIDIAEQHIKNLTSLNIFSKYVILESKNAEFISNNIFLLPCYPDYPISKAKKITYLIKVFMLSISYWNEKVV